MIKFYLFLVLGLITALDAQVNIEAIPDVTGAKPEEVPAKAAESSPGVNESEQEFFEGSIKAGDFDNFPIQFSSLLCDATDCILLEEEVVLGNHVQFDDFAIEEAVKTIESVLDAFFKVFNLDNEFKLEKPQSEPTASAALESNA